MTAVADPARIGPNAIIRIAEALRDRFGEGMAEPLLHEATGYHLTGLPSAMVDEREPLALVKAVVERLGVVEAAPVLRDAGHRTGDYLLANRIPRVAQWIIRVAPRRVGLAILLQAMAKNAWTFAGSGRFRIVRGGGWPQLVFEECAMCRELHATRPMCDFYAGTFERLIAVLVAPSVQVVEVECLAQGGGVCRFELLGI